MSVQLNQAGRRIGTLNRNKTYIDIESYPSGDARDIVDTLNRGVIDQLRKTDKELLLLRSTYVQGEQELKLQIDAIQRSLDERTSQNAALGAEITGLNQRIEARQEQYNTMATERDVLSAQLAAVMAGAGSVNANYRQMQAELGQATAAAAAVRDELLTVIDERDKARNDLAAVVDTSNGYK